MKRLAMLCSALFLLGAVPAALGQAYPTKPILARLHGEIVRIISEPETRQRITADGSEPVGSTPEQFRKFLHADLAKWAKIVKESGAKVD